MPDLGFASPTAHTVGTLGLGGDWGALANSKLFEAISRNLRDTGSLVRKGFADWRAPVVQSNPLITYAQGAPMQLFSGSGASLSSTDWGGILGGIGQAITGIYATKAQTKQLKQLNRLLGGSVSPSTGLSPYQGFAPVATVPAASGGGLLGGLLGGALGAGAGALGLLPNILPGGLEESGTGLFGPDLFAPTNAGARQRMIDAPHPTTGERVYWRPVGRPLMFAGDAALLRRTRKLARKLDAGCGAARATFRRRRRR